MIKPKLKKLRQTEFIVFFRNENYSSNRTSFKRFPIDHKFIFLLRLFMNSIFHLNPDFINIYFRFQRRLWLIFLMIALRLFFMHLLRLAISPRKVVISILNDSYRYLNTWSYVFWFNFYSRILFVQIHICLIKWPIG